MIVELVVIILLTMILFLSLAIFDDYLNKRENPKKPHLRLIMGGKR